MSDEILKQLAELNEQFKKLEKTTAELHAKLPAEGSLHGPVSQIADAAKKAGEVAAQAAARKAPSEWHKLISTVAATVLSAWIIAQCGIKPAGEAATKAVEKVGDLSRSNSDLAASNAKVAASNAKLAEAIWAAQDRPYPDGVADVPRVPDLLPEPPKPNELPKPKIYRQ